MENPTPPPVPPASSSTYQWMFVVAFIAEFAVIFIGANQALHGKFEFLIAAIIPLLIVVMAWPIALSVAASRAAEDAKRMAIMQNMASRLTHMSGLLTTISQQQLLSDRAKAVAYRGNDRQALRKAIQEEMNAKDWDAALVLANDMEREFGYAQEAAALRGEINNNRTEVISRQISEALSVIDEHTRLERWNPAMREADRIAQIYPNDERAKQLPQEIENRRQALKRQLLDGWKDANARNDIDGSIEILKKVDPYLTPAEAASMQEAARGIFRERLNQMRDRFARAVHDEKWNDAIRLGELIMAEHPNSRLALEVRDTMETLRQRAGKHAEVA